MNAVDRIRGRQVGILGMARSGMAAALLAKRLGSKPFVSDAADRETLLDRTNVLDEQAIPYETGGHTPLLMESDFLVLSPGVPLDIGILSRAHELGIPFFSEIEFASWVCQGRIVAITGSNGKTTTTTLAGEIFNAAGFDTVVCGNIGRPFADIADRVSESAVVMLEVSTYQLETIADFRPHVAAILNLTPDHLQRHGSFEKYKQAKYRITENQEPDDYLVLNREDVELDAARIESKAIKRFFSATNSVDSCAFVRDGRLQIRDIDRAKSIVEAAKICIPGPHNLQNAAAAVCIASLFDIDVQIMGSVLRSFKGVEHRLESVGSVAGIRFINDSKATNVESVCYALRSIEPSVYLIMGGQDKGSSYTPIITHGRGRIAGIVVIGEARQKIFEALGRDFAVEFAPSLEDAVALCFDRARPGDTVLLSPGCASFDMFDDFEHRGRAFKEAVASLKNGKNNSETVSN
ncbi:MAG: UDP-N-acetylmuramoyl-L-alanine--D-glutamate ligase [Candidatus Zixiibacteriota bacterium]